MEALMRMLIPVDRHTYSQYVVTQASHLARNTWADVSILGVGGSHDEDISAMMDAHRRDFLQAFNATDSPYGEASSAYNIIQTKKGCSELVYDGVNARKSLKAKMRHGNPAKEILAESEEAEIDLIVIGSTSGKGFKWIGHEDTPQKILKNAQCSVLLAKEERKPKMIVCCLDHASVSQASIELINQLVTLNQAELEIVGVTGGDGLKYEVDRKIAKILKYFTDCDIKAWIRLVDSTSLPAFINQTAEENLVALWMGKESFLDKIFFHQRIDSLLSASESSILILR